MFIFSANSRQCVGLVLEADQIIEMSLFGLMCYPLGHMIDCDRFIGQRWLRAIVPLQSEIQCRI